MKQDFISMVELIRELTRAMDELTQTQRTVAAAVHTDDLAALAECMKKQQALALSLRNIDLKRAKQQQAMGIETLRLSELSDCAPDEETRQLVKNAAEQAANQYRLLQSASEVARSALECSLHEVEGMMTRMGIDPAQAQERTASVSGAHTDFHA